MRLILTILTLSISFAASLEAKSLVACKQTSQMGLYEQCQEVKMIKNLGEQSRVYSLAQKKLLSWETSKIFELKNLNANENLKANDLIVVPGQLFWSASSNFHRTLCKSENSNQASKILTLNCGKSEPQKVNRNLVFKLVRIPTSDQFSHSLHSKK